MLVAILIVLINIGIFIQDILQRSVNIFLLMLLIFGLMLGDYVDLVECSMENLLANTSMLFIQLGALTLYFSIKKRKWVLITEKYLGPGDILFLLIVAPCFQPLFFLLYLVASFTLALIFTLMYVLIRKRKSASIPLLSFLSLMLVVIGFVYLYLPEVSFKFFKSLQTWNY